MEYLITRYGKFLTPKQLSQEIPSSTKQQSKLRKENDFPIPHKNIGKNVYYSVYKVASFLIDDEVQEVKEQKEKPVNSVIKKQKKNAESNTEDLSYIFNLKGFVSHLEQQRDNIDNLITFFSKKIAYEEMNQDLSNKNTDKKKSKA